MFMNVCYKQTLFITNREMNVSSSFEGNTRRHSAGLGNEGGKGRKSVILSRLPLEKQAASHNSERLGEVWLIIFPYPWVLILQYF